jgi:TM2 domain-containing membrane protein YozV
MNCDFIVISIVGVLKSILQIFFGIFAFDRLVLNNKTIIGIILSLIGGTVFSYLEYTNKQISDVKEVTIDDEKFTSMSNETSETSYRQ